MKTFEVFGNEVKYKKKILKKFSVLRFYPKVTHDVVTIFPSFTSDKDQFIKKFEVFYKLTKVNIDVFPIARNEI